MLFRSNVEVGEREDTADEHSRQPGTQGQLRHVPLPHVIQPPPILLLERSGSNLLFAQMLDRHEISAQQSGGGSWVQRPKSKVLPHTSSQTCSSCQPRLAARAGEQSVRLIIAEEHLPRQLPTQAAFELVGEGHEMAQ